MTRVDFYKLSRAVQDSLLASVRGEFAPRPVLVKLGGRRLVAGWLVVAAIAALLLVGVYVAGFGSVASALAIQPIWALAIYAGLAAVSVIAVFNALAARARAKVMPFPAGIYLFPANVIDAREHVLRVHPLDELKSITPRGSELVATFRGARFAFPVADPSRVPEALQALESARERVSVPLDARERQRLDPLAPPSVASPLAPEIPRTRTPPGWERQRVLLGVAIGAAFGVGLFFVRNILSDAAMLRWARGRDDVASYRSYLERGRRHRDAVSTVHLPRAALREAMAKSSVEAIDAFTREFPETGIKSEIDAARRTALIGEFERAQAAGTFEALLSFAERYPQHGIGPAFDQTRHNLYVRAHHRYRKEMSANVAELVGRLVAYSEKVGTKKTDAGFRGPKVEIRFRRLPSTQMEGADELVRKNPMFNGTVSLPTQHIVPARMEPHERKVAEAMAARFSRAFDPEIVTFEPAPALDGASGEMPPVTTPTLVINYRVESSGAAYASKKPRGIFLGLVFFFQAEFMLPADKQPLRTKLTFVQRVPVDMIRTEGPTSAPGTLEPTVYDRMAGEAFGELQEKYLARWFPNAEPPKP
jgi:hypothetical protein